MKPFLRPLASRLARPCLACLWPLAAVPAAWPAVGVPLRVTLEQDAQAMVRARVLAPGPAPAPPDAPARAPSSEPEMLLLDLMVNGQKQASVARAEQVAGGQLLLAEEAWTEARLRPDGPVRALSDGSVAYALPHSGPIRYQLDRRTLSLDIQAPASAFAASRLEAGTRGSQAATRPEPGAMLNYDLSVSGGSRAASTARGAQVEAVVFGPLGQFVTSGLARDDGVQRTATRLDSYWRYDMPTSMQSLVVGDTIGTGGAWSRPVRFAGLRWGRDFGLRPGFVTQPQLSLAGEAALPSTVDVLVNNVRRASASVPPGPFDLSNVPVVSGAGEVNLVVRDLLGRETVVTQSFYASPRLLAPGLSDFSVEAGLLRSGYGETSHYGDPFAAGTWRRGLDARFTGELRGEWQAMRQAAGADLAAVLGDWAVGQASLATSRGSMLSRDEQGLQLKLGLERSTPYGGVSIQHARSTRGFAPFGEATGSAAPGQRMREQWMLSAAGRLLAPVSTGISLVHQSRWNGETVSSLGASFNAPLAGGMSLNVSMNRRLDASGGWAAYVSLNVPLDNRIHSSSRLEARPDSPPAAVVSASRQAVAADDLGWRIEASNDAARRVRGGVQYHAPAAHWSLEAATDAQGEVAARGAMRGTVGRLSGVNFATQPVGSGSVAVVQVGDLPRVPVKRSNRVVAHTDANGRAFIAGLLPWHANRIEIDPSDLPMDVELPQTEQEVIPHARSGAVVRFEARRNLQALATIHRADGSPIPVGARVLTQPQAQESLAGRRGEVWLTHLRARDQRLQVQWRGGSCELILPPAPQDVQDMAPSIGPLLCERPAP